MDSEFDLFMRKCQEDLCLPSDTRLDDFMEFLEAFTSTVRSDVEDRVRKNIEWDFHNPRGSGSRGPEPDSDEADAQVDEAVHAALREWGLDSGWEKRLREADAALQRARATGRGF